MNRFKEGQRVRLLVDAPPGWGGAFGVETGHGGTITGVPDNRIPTYGVLLDGDPDNLPAAFLEYELTEES